MADLIVDLLRHGEVEGGRCFRGRTDDPLTEHGWLQMRRAVAMRSGWRGIVSSPARRCLRFARHLAETHHIPCAAAAWLWEMDFGDWEGATAAELATTDAARLEAFWRDPSRVSPPNGEPFRRFRQRVLEGWHETVRQGAERLLVVAHGGPIRIILAELLGMPPQNLMRLEIPHAALSRVRLSIDPDGGLHGSLVALNAPPQPERP